METVEQPVRQQKIEPTETPKMYSYSKRPLWQWVLLYFIIGGIIYAGIYYFFFRNKGYNSPNLEGSMHRVTPASGNTQGMEGWKKFTDKTFDFNIQYPPDWTLNAADETQGFKQAYSVDCSSLKTYLKDQNSCTSDTLNHTIFLRGPQHGKTAGSELVLFIYNSAGGGGGNTKQVPITINNKIYNIHVLYMPASDYSDEKNQGGYANELSDELAITGENSIWSKVRLHFSVWESDYPKIIKILESVKSNQSQATNTSTNCSTEGSIDDASYQGAPLGGRVSLDSFQKETQAVKKWGNDAYLVAYQDTDNPQVGRSPSSSGEMGLDIRRIYASSCSSNYLVYEIGDPTAAGGGPGMPSTVTIRPQLETAEALSKKNVIVQQLALNNPLDLSKYTYSNSAIPQFPKFKLTQGYTDSAATITINNQTFNANHSVIQMNNSKKLGIFYEVSYYDIPSTTDQSGQTIGGDVRDTSGFSPIVLATFDSNGNVLSVRKY